MSASGLLKQLYSNLGDVADRAIARGEHKLAARCAYAIDATRKWETSDFHGPPPPDALTLSGIRLESISQDLRLSIPLPLMARAAEETLPFLDLELDAPAVTSEFANSLGALLERAVQSLDSGHVVEAIAGMETVLRGAQALQVRAQRYLDQAKPIWQEMLDQAIDEARKHGRVRRYDLKGRRAQWEAVLALDPDNQEALEAIKEIETAEFEQNLRPTIDDLRKPLQVHDKRIRDVEAARNKASDLLAGGKLRNPDLIAEIQQVYTMLDDFRNQIFRASEGAITAERSGNYEYACMVYRTAILNGFSEIIDHSTGKPIDPVEGLKRTRLAYFEDLKKRAAQRYDDAKASLAAGVPESALRWLKEAQELMVKVEVEEGGTELRRDIIVLMDRVNLEVDQKQVAEKLVLDAQRHNDPAEARLLLMRAKQIYSTYPGIDHLIKGKETLVMFKTLNEVTQDLINADVALYTRRFPEARQHCSQALSRGRNLEISNDELQAKRQAAEEMLKMIAEEEKHLADLVNKMLKIDQSLERDDQRLAQRMVDLLTSEERNSPEGLEPLSRLQLAHEDAQSGEVKRAEQETASPA